MKILCLLSLLPFLISCNHKSDQKDSFYMPAEYESHEAIWLGWQDFGPYKQPFLDLAETLNPHVSLKLIANSDSSLQNLQSALIERSIDTSTITFYVIEDNRLWMRDHGATYLLNERGEKQVVDFGWTLYGNYDFLLKKYEGNVDSAQYYYQRDLKTTGWIDSLMGVYSGATSIKTPVNMEGGSIEVNGKGTLILCERVTFQRNPTMSKSELEAEFKKALGIRHIIWLPEGLADDPYLFSQIAEDYYGWGTYGHTDEFVRFVDERTVLLAWVEQKDKDKNPINWINHERMTKNLEILENSTDQDGQPIRVIKVPLPDLMYKEVEIVDKRKDDFDMNVNINWIAQSDQELSLGDSIKRVPASSYLNYLVTNGVVVLPSYIAEGTPREVEQEVEQIFRQAFPNRELRWLNAMNLNYFGGGIHCITQQEP